MEGVTRVAFQVERHVEQRNQVILQCPSRLVAYLRMADPTVVPGQWFTEHDGTGRRLRQVELRPDGTSEATSASNWPMNPPFDFGDPQYARMEITMEEFERVWADATSPEE